MKISILDLPMGSNDANATTIRGYLKALLSTLIQEGEGFSGKRPFGNSGWNWDLYLPLIRAKLVKGNADGYLEDVDGAAAEKLILEAIESL